MVLLYDTFQVTHHLGFKLLNDSASLWQLGQIALMLYRDTYYLLVVGAALTTGTMINRFHLLLRRCIFCFRGLWLTTAVIDRSLAAHIIPAVILALGHLVPSTTLQTLGCTKML